MTFGAGVHPAVDLMFIATDGGGDFFDAMEYAIASGIEFVVLPIVAYQPCNDQRALDGSLLPCAGSLRASYFGARESFDFQWASATDSTITYVIAAGNNGWDLSSGAFPDVDGFCSGVVGGICLGSTLVNIDTFPDPGAVGPSNNLVVAASNPRGELAARWPGDRSSGTNFGVSRSEGGNPIDLVAPGESLLLPSVEAIGTGMTGDFIVVRTRGTSFAAPIAAGVGALVASTFPDIRRRPAAIVDRLVSTRRACQTSAGGARSCDQAMLHPGIVDVAGALDLANSPPPVGPWVDDTFLLGPSRIGAGNVQDVKMFSPTTSSSAETMLLELSGGVDGVRYRPRLWEWDDLQGRFRPVAGTALPRIPVEGTTETEPLRGNFSEAAIADFDGDGCTDMAWAGFVEPNPDSPRRCSGPGTSACMTDADCPADEVCEPLLPLREVDNLLLFQERTPLGDCTGRFNDVTAARYPSPNGGVSRDIDVLDANGDGRPDLVITNSDFQPGLWTSTVLDQLLINVDCPPLTPGSPFGCFVDEAAARFPVTTFEDEENVTTSMGCDVNGDGHEDIVRVSPVNPDQVLINDGTGRFNIDANSGISDEALSLSHDAVCADLFGNDGLSDIVVARGGGAPSYGTSTTAFDAGATDLGPRKNRFFVNGFASGVPGEFSDESSAVLPDVADHSRAVAACDLDGDGFPELVFANGEEPQRSGNGTASLPTRETNRILAVQPLLAFEDADDVLGFDFHPNGTIRDDGVTDDGSSVTRAIECGDLDGDGRDDALIFGNVAHHGLRVYRLEAP